MSLAVEASDGTEAVKRAKGFIPPPSAPRERAGHHWIDLARGYLLHGDREHALSSPWRHGAPPHSRPGHPMVAETVRTLAHAERAAPTPSAGSQTWMGITTWRISRSGGDGAIW